MGELRSKKKTSNDKHGGNSTKKMEDDFKKPAFYSFMDELWEYIPRRWESLVASVIIFIAASGMRGEYVFVLVHFLKQYYPSNIEEATESSNTILTFLQKRFADAHVYIFYSMLSSYLFYFGICGFLQWYYYYKQRDKPEEWKCQPNKFLSWEDEKHEILLGSWGIAQGSITSGLLTTWVSNGGFTTLYYQWDDYGWSYLLLSFVFIFLYLDAGSYYHHKLYHYPILYRNFHKMHHRYKQPTPFSVSAFHPFELFTFQTVLILPVLVVPVHWVPYMFNIFYFYYYGIIDHSGIVMDSWWPWQTSSTFHDMHHQFFHCNFGFSLDIWDRLHGTCRDENKVYSEDIFYGKGKDLTDASQEDIEKYKESLSWSQ